jgi:hypothetical protein
VLKKHGEVPILMRNEASAIKLGLDQMLKYSHPCTSKGRRKKENTE